MYEVREMHSISDSQVSNSSRSGWYECRSKWPIFRAVSLEDGKRVEGGEEVFKFVKGKEGNGE